MTAVHSHHHHSPHERASQSPGAGGGFSFPRSGLGTPDFFYFAGGSGSTGSAGEPSGAGAHSSGLANTAASSSGAPAPASAAAGGLGTPSWFRPPSKPGTSNAAPGAFGASSSTAATAARPASAGGSHTRSEDDSQQRSRARSDNPDADTKAEDDGNRVRASSDPPVSQTPKWMIGRTKLDQEPNPFERSFSGKAPYEMASMRRARSQSPKSAHGPGGGGGSSGSGGVSSLLASIGNPAGASSAYGSMLGGAAGKIPGLSSASSGGTPSHGLPGFSWSMDGSNSLRSGPLSPSMLNGPAYGGANMFDPSSIRTGLTPGPLTAAGGPHSPATQALFAMMTNATPGLPPSPAKGPPAGGYGGGVDSQQENRENHGFLPHAALHSQESGRSDSSASRSPPNPQHAGGSNAGGSLYSQSVPRPMQPFPPSQTQPSGRAPPGPPPPNNPHPNAAAHFQAARNAYLQQNVPRPLPPSAINGPAAAQAAASQAHLGAGPAGNGNSLGTDNPLYLLSQAHAALNSTGGAAGPSNGTGNGNGSQDGPDDASLLAAAALSGLSTPRPAYVGGPQQGHQLPPSVSQAAANMNLRHPSAAGKPPSSGAQPGNKPAPQASASTAAGNKRKKGASPPAANSAKVKQEEKDQAAAASAAAAKKGKKGQAQPPAKRARRSAAAVPQVAQAAPPELEDRMNEDGEDDDLDDDDEDGMMDDDGMNVKQEDRSGSPTGSASGSRGDGNSPPKKTGGRGPKQQFETEEEKRKNFLERNRQAALKCRQRKKAWLTQLQSKTDLLTAENEHLQNTVAQLREEITGLRAVLISHKDCPLAAGMGINGGPGQTIGALLAAQAQQHGLQSRPY